MKTYNVDFAVSCFRMPGYSSSRHEQLFIKEGMTKDEVSEKFPEWMKTMQRKEEDGYQTNLYIWEIDEDGNETELLDLCSTEDIRFKNGSAYLVKEVNLNPFQK